MKLSIRKLAGAVAVSALVFAGFRNDSRPGWRVSVGPVSAGIIRNDPLGNSLDGFGRVQYRHYYAGLWSNLPGRSHELYGFRKFGGSVYFQAGSYADLVW